MKVSLNAIITDFGGKQILDEDKSTVTVGKICTNVLGNLLPGDERLTGEDKLGLYKLGLKVHGANEADLTADEIALIKERVARTCPPIVIGFVWNAIDPASLKKGK